MDSIGNGGASQSREARERERESGGKEGRVRGGFFSFGCEGL